MPEGVSSVCPDFNHHNNGWKIKTEFFFPLKTHLVTHFHQKNTSRTT
jgi:hypothetical protein